MLDLLYLVLIVAGFLVLCAVIVRRGRRRPRLINRTEVDTFELELQLCEDVVGALEEEEGTPCRCPG